MKWLKKATPIWLVMVLVIALIGVSSALAVTGGMVVDYADTAGWHMNHTGNAVIEGIGTECDEGGNFDIYIPIREADGKDLMANSKIHLVIDGAWVGNFDIGIDGNAQTGEYENVFCDTNLSPISVPTSIVATILDPAPAL